MGINNPVTPDAIGAVPIARQIIAGLNMTGGGALSSDVTLGATASGGGGGGGGGGSSWVLHSKQTISVPVASVDFIDIDATDILLISENIALSSSSVSIAQVSVDNGVSFFTTSGDYLAIDSAGTPVNTTGCSMSGANHTTAKWGGVLLVGANVIGAPRLLRTLPGGSTPFRPFIANQLNPINAIRVAHAAGANLTAGTIYCFIRPRSDSWSIISEIDLAGESAFDVNIDASLYNEIEISVRNYVSGNDGTELYLRLGVGDPVVIQSGLSDYSFSKRGLFGSAGVGSSFTATDTTFDAMQFPATGISNIAGEAFSGSLKMSGLKAGVYAQVYGQGVTYKSDNTILEASCSGRYNSTTAISGLRILPNAGIMSSGSIIVRAR